MSDGMIIQIIDAETAYVEDSTTNEKTFNKHRVKIDIATYKRLIEQAVREQVVAFTNVENYNIKIAHLMDRTIELAVKSVQGQIETMVEIEVERLVKERVARMVQDVQIGMQITVENPK